MGLLRRMEQTRQEAVIQNAGPSPSALVPVAPDARPASGGPREALLNNIKLRILDDVIGGASSIFDADGETDMRTKIEAIVDQTIRVSGFAGTRAERLAQARAQRFGDQVAEVSSAVLKPRSVDVGEIVAHHIDGGGHGVERGKKYWSYIGGIGSSQRDQHIPHFARYLARRDIPQFRS